MGLSIPARPKNGLYFGAGLNGQWARTKYKFKQVRILSAPLSRNLAPYNKLL